MLGHWSLALFLMLLSLQLGLAMELVWVTVLGSGLSLLAALRLLKVERPTWGLTFVLLATGGFLGDQILADWAIERSWAQRNSLFAGLIMSLLLYLLWLFAARARENINAALERDSQTVLVLGLLLMLLGSPPDESLLSIADRPVPVLAVAGIMLAALTLLLDRTGPQIWQRLLLLLPLAAVVPALMLTLGQLQGPALLALSNLFPEPSREARTGFSPNQSMQPALFLQPSNRAVMRIEAERQPLPYLVGNRLNVLSQSLEWLPTERPSNTLTINDAFELGDGAWEFPLAIYSANAVPLPPQTISMHNLIGDSFLFLPSNAASVSGVFLTITVDASDMRSPAFDRGADKRWEVLTGSLNEPDFVDPNNLLLPSFWDGELQTRVEQFAAAEPTATVSNVVSYFQSRPYSLETDFDEERPFHDFILSDKPAYCFWFASATTLALRANNIPARLVGGYMLHEQIDSNLWLVRERDAHSWVEWQDAEGYWHTVDPTPASMDAFFGGYQSSQFSRWYHRTAASWQKIIDRILENDLSANLIRWGGLAVLAFLFIREYRRIRGERLALNSSQQRWQRLWRRLGKLLSLQVSESWTLSRVAEELPSEMEPSKRDQIIEFLNSYNEARYSADSDSRLADLEQELERLASSS